MKYFDSNSTDPRWNLALEQYIFENMDKNDSYFMFWQNDNTIVVGKNQNTLSEINVSFVQEHDITVVRRLSGGGTVYHDLGNLNFTFITDSEQMEQINFHTFCLPIVKSLAELGITASISGRNDITIEGKKFSGNSQYIKSNRVLHHGTLLFDSDLSVLEQALKVSKDKISSNGVKSVSSRVTNIKPHLPNNITLSDFKSKLLQQISSTQTLESLYLSDEDLHKIDNIKTTRYDSWDWNYGYSPAHTIYRRQRFEACGIVEAAMDVKNGKITSIIFSGDFFGNSEINELTEYLRGCKYRYQDVLKRLQNCNIEDYIHNMNTKQMASFLCSEDT